MSSQTARAAISATPLMPAGTCMPDESPDSAPAALPLNLPAHSLVPDKAGVRRIRRSIRTQRENGS